MYFFFFTDTPTPDIYTLSLHDALPISSVFTVCSCNSQRTDRASQVSRTAAQRSFRSEEHTSELQSRVDLVCRLLLEKKKQLHTCCHIPRANSNRRDQIRVQDLTSRTGS